MHKPLILLALLAVAAVGHAASKSYRVVQNVGSLSLGQASVGDPYLYLEFQLTNGSQNGLLNSSVRINNISLTGGAFDFNDTSLGDLGNVTGTRTDFTLRGDSPVSDRALLFRVQGGNAVLSYDFTLSNDGVDALIPDGFNVGMIYRPNATDIDTVSTLGATGSEMVSYTFDGIATAPSAYDVDRDFAIERAKMGDGRFLGLGTPTITAAPVPEPATIAALSLGALAMLRRRKR